jgi:hypothetical protein
MATASQFIPTFGIALLLSASASAQIVGGGSETVFRFDGANTNDRLGQEVSGAGDVNNDGFDDIILGLEMSDASGFSSSGSAFVYSGADGSLLYQWNGSATYESLGCSVSNAGDINADGFDDVIVGAYGASPAGVPAAGAAYAYSGLDGSLLYQWSGSIVDDNFGSIVSGAGDVNGDGFDDVIIGAEGASVGALTNVGAAYVYSGADGAQLYMWNGVDNNDKFGASVSDAGDVNADGFNDVILGAPQAHSGGISDTGLAFVYSGADGSILYQMHGADAYDNLGASVSGVGDTNGDGFADFLVGVPTRTVFTLSEAGSAFLYSGADGIQIYQWDGDADYLNLGSVVSGAGDFDQDGFDDVLVSARYASPGGIYEAGSAYVYSGSSYELLYQWDGEASGDKLGISIASVGNVNGDAYPEIIVGANRASPGGRSEAGSAYVFGFRPYMTANRRSVSATNGGTLNLALTFPTSAGLNRYKVLISASGTGPGFRGVAIPLTLDSLVMDTYFGNYPVPSYSNMHGTLDASGNAGASLTVPAGIPGGLVGRTYYFAAIANQPGQLPGFSSIAVPLEITL